MFGRTLWHAKGRGFVDVKTGAACGFAAVGVGLAVWSGVSGGGEARARAVEGGDVITTLDGEGNAAEAQYESTKGADAARVVGSLARAAADAAKGINGFGSQGAGSAGALEASVQLALVGLVTGDHGAFLQAMTALGAALPGDLEGEHPVFERMKGKLAGAKIDLTRLEVVPHAERRGGPRMRERSEESGEGGGRNYNERVMEMRSGDLFKDATDGVDERAVDVRFPFLAKGADEEEWFGLVLVWNGDVKKWQPGAFQVIKRELEVMP